MLPDLLEALTPPHLYPVRRYKRETTTRGLSEDHGRVGEGWRQADFLEVRNSDVATTVHLLTTESAEMGDRLSNVLESDRPTGA